MNVQAYLSLRCALKSEDPVSHARSPFLSSIKKNRFYVPSTVCKLQFNSLITPPDRLIGNSGIGQFVKGKFGLNSVFCSSPEPNCDHNPYVVQCQDELL